MYELLTIIIFFLYNVANAHFDADRIKSGKRIYHGINGAAYIIMLAIQHYIFADLYLTAALAFVRLLVFNIALSLYRGLPFDYISPKPKSIIDKATKWVFQEGIIMYGIYAMIFILLICKIYLWS